MTDPGTDEFKDRLRRISEGQQEWTDTYAGWLRRSWSYLLIGFSVLFMVWMILILVNNSFERSDPDSRSAPAPRQRTAR